MVSGLNYVFNKIGLLIKPLIASNVFFNNNVVLKELKKQTCHHQIISYYLGFENYVYLFSLKHTIHISSHSFNPVSFHPFNFSEPPNIPARLPFSGNFWRCHYHHSFPYFLFDLDHIYTSNSHVHVL